MRSSGFLIFCLLVPALTGPAHAQTASKDQSESARAFVQDFYTWYAAKNSARGRTSDIAIREKPSLFSARLVRELKEDSAAQDKVPDDIVGLDFDPFLNAQDPCQRYQAGPAVAKGAGYRVDVYGVCSGKKDKKAAVTAEVVQKDGRWTFVNFYYPGDGDLLETLKILREERAKPAK